MEERRRLQTRHDGRQHICTQRGSFDVDDNDGVDDDDDYVDDHIMLLIILHLLMF